MDNNTNLNIQKRKHTLAVFLIIMILVLAFLGLSYAFFEYTLDGEGLAGSVTCYTVNYVKGQEISGELILSSDYTSGKSTDLVMYSNPSCESMLGTLYITTNEESTMSFEDQALKYTVVVNNEVVAEGSVDGTENQVIYQDFTLNTVETTYKVYIWLDEDLEDETILGVETYSGFIHADAIASTVEPPIIYEEIDDSNANAPAYAENLVPVMYNGTTWVTADVTSSTSTYGWYDYDAKKWANAVLLTETKRNNLTKTGDFYTPGQAIGDTESDGVLAFYVWIPRYKYKVWNIDKVVGTDTYSAQTKGIDIVFESGTGKTGGITCTYDFTKTASSSVRNETCTDSGTEGYYTHPAFTFGNDELTGFWMGKFEISSSNPSATDGGSSSTTLAPRILPNVASWRCNLISNYWKVIKDMQNTNNIYGISTDTTAVDTHMLTNMEWGAVAYLTHSKYGRCTGGDSSTCTEVTINNSSSYITGNAGNTITASSASGTTNPYTTTNGGLASTTGNIYGVYDMSGGAYEYVMGNVSSASGSYTYQASSAGSNYTYNGNEKYVTPYAYGSGNYNQTAYNRARLGDATGEVVTRTGGMGGWYSDYAGFAYSSRPWFNRGGGCGNGSNAGVFGFNGSDGNSLGNVSSRGALAVFSA